MCDVRGGLLDASAGGFSISEDEACVTTVPLVWTGNSVSRITPEPLREVWLGAAVSCASVSPAPPPSLAFVSAAGRAVLMPCRRL